jgi:2-keto-4-pentenoate hydratase/2-oxohepta-3-ene-1,7-dioic acid hydratase in catechol pathway
MERVQMKIIRYCYENTVSNGILEDGSVKEIREGLFGDIQETGSRVDFGDVELMCPCEPSKILAVGLNYRSHLGGRAEPQEPAVFLVPSTALLPSGGDIRIPADAEDVHYEGELVAVIGKTVRDATPAEAAVSILGFTCGNDVSERHWQKNDLQWWRAKGCDTFAPMGPFIVTDFDWKQSGIRTLVDGEVVQEGRFNELLFDPPNIISYISRYMTLNPGDVVFTGTPGNTRALKPGETVEVEIEGLGKLSNGVVKSPVE